MTTLPANVTHETKSSFRGYNIFYAVNPSSRWICLFIYFAISFQIKFYELFESNSSDYQKHFINTMNIEQTFIIFDLIFCLQS